MSLSAVLRQLDSVPSPRGGELASAVALARFCAATWPHIDWQVERYGDRGGNLIATHGPGPLLYSHLDTSLDGAPQDVAITGGLSSRPLRIDGDRVSGFGLGVARGPVAAAIVAFAEATSGSLLLAGSGTHRRGDPAAGIRHHLACHGLPGSAVVAKSGPATILWEEPGMLYLQVRLRSRHGAALAPSSASPIGGLVAHAGPVIAALSSWGTAFVGRAGRGQMGRAAGLGALRSGSPAKPDLLPGSLVLDLCLVTAPPDEPEELRESLLAHLRDSLAGTPVAECPFEVDLELVQPPASTPADAPIVWAAAMAWKEEFGDMPPPIEHWTGSTDGGVLRSLGVATVRLGPQISSLPDDATTDLASLEQLAAYSRIYTRLLQS